MVERDILIAKTATIQRCLARIGEITGLDPTSLDDLDKQDIFVLNLQRAVKAAIDLAAHVAASEEMGIPETASGCFTLLHRGGIIGARLHDRMTKMTGFRNIAVHDYQTLDPEILKSILANGLRDLEEFYATVLAYFEGTKTQDNR